MTALAPPGTADLVVDRLWPRPDPYLEDPVGWVHDVLREDTWSGQDEILRALVDHRRVAVRSAHGVGKSHIASRAAAWWIATHPIDDVFLVSSAPGAPQIRGILWRYIKDAHRRAGLDGYITDAEIPEWKIGGRLVGWGRKPPDRVNADQAATAFQGIHAKYLLVILDEGAGIPRWLFGAVTSLVTAPTNRVLVIGNPDDPQSEFERVCRTGTRWHKIRISAFDSPAYTGEQVAPLLAERLVSTDWVEDVRDEYGEDSNYWISKVLAEFPEHATDAMIAPWLVREARGRAPVDPAPDGPLGGVLALDVARSEGGDANTLVSAFRGAVEIRDQWRESDAVKTARRAYDALRECPPNWKLIVDGDGVGGPVFDLLRSWGANVVEFRGSMRPRRRPDRYRNRRAEAYAGAEQQLRAGLVALPPEGKGRAADLADQLALDLSTPQRVIDASGRIGVERKEDIVRRLGRSPDLGDAVVMALYVEPDVHSEGAYRPPSRGTAITAGVRTDPHLW